MKNAEPIDFDLPSELASFVGFIGGEEIEIATSKVLRKLSTLSRAPRTLFGDRYFFHQQIIRFTDTIPSFAFNPMDRQSIRAASFIAGINLARRTISSLAATRLRKMIIDNLKPDRDFRQIEHEIRAFIHLRQKFGSVQFADLEGTGNFDLICSSAEATVEIECKTISTDTGNPIKTEMVVNLIDAFLKIMQRSTPTPESGIFRITFLNDTTGATSILRDFREAIARPIVSSIKLKDAEVEFIARPLWTQKLRDNSSGEVADIVFPDPHLDDSRCITVVGQSILALSIRSKRENTLAHRIVRVLKDAADQLSGERPSLVWLQFVGLSEQELREVASFSMSGRGDGLNAIVAEALSPIASATDRAHVTRVRFTSEPADPIQHVDIAADRLIRTTSLGGLAYDVTNPRSTFPSSEFIF